MANWLRITQTRSHTGRLAVQKKTLFGLGITKRGRTAYVLDTPSSRGQLGAVLHLVEWAEVSDAEREAALARAKVKTPSYEVVDAKPKDAKAKPAEQAKIEEPAAEQADAEGEAASEEAVVKSEE